MSAPPGRLAPSGPACDPSSVFSSKGRSRGVENVSGSLPHNAARRYLGRRCGAFQTGCRAITKKPAVGKAAGDGASGPSFGSLLKEAVGSVLEAGRKSDAQTQAMAAGKSNVVDLVTAVSETEVAIESMVAVRDKVIAAYEEIMRMPI